MCALRYFCMWCVSLLIKSFFFLFFFCCIAQTRQHLWVCMILCNGIRETPPAVYNTQWGLNNCVLFVSAPPPCFSYSWIPKKQTVSGRCSCIWRMGFSAAYLGHIHGLRSENHSAAALFFFSLSLFACYPAKANVTHGASPFDVYHIIHLLIWVMLWAHH